MDEYEQELDRDVQQEQITVGIWYLLVVTVESGSIAGRKYVISTQTHGFTTPQIISAHQQWAKGFKDEFTIDVVKVAEIPF